MFDEVDGENENPPPPQGEFTAEEMAKIRALDVTNIRMLAATGKVLTREQIKRLELAAGETMSTVGEEEWATSQSDLAAKLKVSDRKSIQRWLKITGMQAPPGATPDGRYNVKSWAAWMERTGRSGRVKEPASALETTKSKLALLDLRMKEIEFDELQGRKIDLEECTQVLTEVMSRLSQAMRAIKHRLGPSVVGESVPEATKRIGAVVDETLASIAIPESVKKKPFWRQLSSTLSDLLRMSLPGSTPSATSSSTTAPTPTPT